jgi:hypothetical protein
VAHTPVKAEKLSLAAVGMLEQELLVPNLFLKKGIDDFKGAKDDTVSVTVEGVLPFHEYAWRNNRSSGISFDEYAERKVSVTFGGNYYSAVKLTDEQADMDFEGWSKLLRPQVKAVARGLQRAAVSKLTGQTYQVTIGNVGSATAGALKGALIEARRVLNKFNVPQEGRILLVGSNFESVLLNDASLNLASNVGDSEAENALVSATIGNRFGFRIVVDQTIGADDAYAMHPSAFIFLNAAPQVPSSVPFGSTSSFEGISARWVRDYDPTYMQDRSVVNTYAGFREVKDVLVGWDDTNKTEVVSASEYLVRAIKLTLDGSSNYPAAASEIATITGVSDASVWTPTGRGAETDVTDPGANNS